MYEEVRPQDWWKAAQTLEGYRGAVVSGHPLATLAGLKMLAQGGNAVDAAVAAAAVSAVVLPDMASMGSDLVSLVKVSNGPPLSVTACGGVPAAWRIGMPLPFDGPAATLVPAAPKGWMTLVENFGRLGIGTVLAPAQELADGGFPAGYLLAYRAYCQEDRLSRFPSSYVFRGLKPTTRIRQPELAQTLQKILVAGIDDFYEGETAHRLIKGITDAGGVLQLQDLASLKIEISPAIATDFAGMTVWTTTLPTHGVGLLQLLRLSEPILHQSGGHEALIAILRNLQRVLRLRDRWLGDPLYVPVPSVQDLLSVEWMQQVLEEKGPIQPTRGETTFLASVDAEGGACALMQSVYTVFGSAFVEPNTGVLLNNRLAAFSPLASSPNRAEIGKRPIHNMTPCMVTAGDVLKFVFGTPGGYSQLQANWQFLVYRLLEGMSTYEAVHAPRWVHGTLASADPEDPVSIEPPLYAQWAPSLKTRGWQVEELRTGPGVMFGEEIARTRSVGSIKAIERDPKTGTLFAVADHRRHGYAAVL